MNRVISWFEIPVSDLARASKFYGTVLGVSLGEQAFGPTMLAIFPYDRESGATGGALVKSENPRPTPDGTIVYLNAGDSVGAVLDRVEQAGGKIAMPRTELPQGAGVIGILEDPDGNRVGVHAMK